MAKASPPFKEEKPKPREKWKSFKKSVYGVLSIHTGFHIIIYFFFLNLVTPFKHRIYSYGLNHTNSEYIMKEKKKKISEMFSAIGKTSYG